MQTLLFLIPCWAAYVLTVRGIARTNLAVRYERQARGIMRTRLFSKGAPRLCGYHLGALDRPGQMALLDSHNCEVCNAPK